MNQVLIRSLVNVELPAEPYNDFWLDCVYNNLLGALNQRDRRFNDFPCSMASTYFLNEPLPGIAPAELPERLLSEGWLMMQVADREGTSSHKWTLSRWLDFEAIERVELAEMGDFILESLHAGWYLFVDIDRQLLPRAKVFAQRADIHPAFIHGIDADSDCYLSIDDCVQPGRLERYAIARRLFDEAYAAALAQESAPRVFRYRIKADLPTFSISAAQVLENLHYRLEEHIDDTFFVASGYPQLQRRQGLSCIGRLADVIGDVFCRIDPKHVQQYIPVALPRQNQVVNLNLIERLRADRTLTDSPGLERVTELYRGLEANWDVYRKKMYKAIMYRELGKEVRTDYFDDIAQTLRQNHRDELEATEQFADIVARACRSQPYAKSPS